MSEIITPKAPAILHGPKVQTAAEILAKATPEQIKALTSFNFAAWAQYSGVQADGRKFDFDSHRYLLPLYLEEHNEIVWQKAAQLGATVYVLLRLLWYARYHQCNVSLYFPTADAVKNLSKGRLGPIISENKELSENIINSTDSLSLKMLRNIHNGLSSVYMTYLGGQATKDSTPLDVVAFDELRLVEEKDVDQALERISHSTYKVRMFVSTAGHPYQDINKRFILGSQKHWAIKCHCSDGGFIPSDSFPDCIVEDKIRNEVYLRCPKCKVRVVDPQNGFYLAKNPNANYPSYHVSQLCSRYISPKEIWEFYKRTTNMKEFYNAKLGRPWIDADNQPVTEDILEECVNYDSRWAFELSEKDRKNGVIAMGVDQHGGPSGNYVVIMKRGPDGKKQILHLEVIERENPRYWDSNGKSQSPFKRLYELAREFNPAITIIDAQPNINEAQDFARTFPGKVWLAWYGETPGPDIAKWHDKIRMKEAHRKSSKETKLKWQVTLSRYSSLDYSLKQFTDHVVQMPHPDKLVQVVRNIETGLFQEENICRTRLWVHLKSMIRNKEIVDSETGKFKMTFIYAGRDPHFTHAFNYCNYAIERAKRLPIFVI